MEKKQTSNKTQLKYGWDHRRYVRITKGMDSFQGTAVNWRRKRGKGEQDRSVFTKKKKKKQKGSWDKKLWSQSDFKMNGKRQNKGRKTIYMGKLYQSNQSQCFEGQGLNGPKSCTDSRRKRETMQEKSELIHFQVLLLKVSRYIFKEKTPVTFMYSQWGTVFLLTQNYHLIHMNLLSADSGYIFKMGSKDLN